jgi:hypothetical protein
MKKKNKSNSFWRDGFSIDETRVSAMIILLYFFSAIAAYKYVDAGDFSTNMLQLLIALITAIAGANIAESFASRMNDRLPYRGEPYSPTTIERSLDEDDRGRPTI